jgi:hypothetical protein
LRLSDSVTAAISSNEGSVVNGVAAVSGLGGGIAVRESNSVTRMADNRRSGDGQIADVGSTLAAVVCREKGEVGRDRIDQEDELGTSAEVSARVNSRPDTGDGLVTSRNSDGVVVEEREQGSTAEGGDGGASSLGGEIAVVTSSVVVVGEGGETGIDVVESDNLSGKVAVSAIIRSSEGTSDNAVANVSIVGEGGSDSDREDAVSGRSISKDGEVGGVQVGASGGLGSRDEGEERTLDVGKDDGLVEGLSITARIGDNKDTSDGGNASGVDVEIGLGDADSVAVIGGNRQSGVDDGSVGSAVQVQRRRGKLTDDRSNVVGQSDGLGLRDLVSASVSGKESTSVDDFAAVSGSGACGVVDSGSGTAIGGGGSTSDTDVGGSQTFTREVGREVLEDGLDGIGDGDGLVSGLSVTANIGSGPLTLEDQRTSGTGGDVDTVEEGIGAVLTSIQNSGRASRGSGSVATAGSGVVGREGDKAGSGSIGDGDDLRDRDAEDVDGNTDGSPGTSVDGSTAGSGGAVKAGEGVGTETVGDGGIGEAGSSNGDVGSASDALVGGSDEDRDGGEGEVESRKVETNEEGDGEAVGASDSGGDVVGSVDETDFIDGVVGGRPGESEETLGVGDVGGEDGVGLHVGQGDGDSSNTVGSVEVGTDAAAIEGDVSVDVVTDDFDKGQGLIDVGTSIGEELNGSGVLEGAQLVVGEGLEGDVVLVEGLVLVSWHKEGGVGGGGQTASVRIDVDLPVGRDIGGREEMEGETSEQGQVDVEEIGGRGVGVIGSVPNDAGVDGSVRIVLDGELVSGN